MWKTPEMLSIKRGQFHGNSCSKGNIDDIDGRVFDGSKSALAETDKIHVYILRSKCGKTPEMLSIIRVRFLILALKGILTTLMVARVR